MFTWIAENLGTIIISVVLLGIVAAIVVKLIKDKRRGRSSCGCGCGCGSCPMSAECHKK